jgi:hypothetical protein
VLGSRRRTEMVSSSSVVVCGITPGQQPDLSICLHSLYQPIVGLSYCPGGALHPSLVGPAVGTHTILD